MPTPATAQRPIAPAPKGNATARRNAGRAAAPSSSAAANGAGPAPRKPRDGGRRKYLFEQRTKYKPGLVRWLESNADSIKLAFGISLALHLALLALRFTFPDASLFRHQDSQLEIVLVNSKSKSKPMDAQARAQANLDGGGNVDENRRAKTPLPASTKTREGDALVEAQRRVQQLEAMQRKLMTQAKSTHTVTAEAEHKSEQPEPPAPVSGQDLAQSALAIARMEAQINKDIDEYQKRPKRRFIGARTSEYVFAQYLEDWRLKIERIGTLNYPDAARGKLYGNLLLYVAIKADGSLEFAEIKRSSGNKILDDAALRIVRMAAPYPVFPPDMRQKTDILEFARRFEFTNGDQLATSDKN